MLCKSLAEKANPNPACRENPALAVGQEDISKLPINAQTKTQDDARKDGGHSTSRSCSSTRKTAQAREKLLKHATNVDNTCEKT
jgi:hypothetical protein